MKTTWQTRWLHNDIVVSRDEKEVDRFAADRIERVFFLHRGAGDTPGDIGLTVVEFADEYALFEPQTGFAGRVNFERQAFWQSRGCVFWVAAASAPLPWRLRLGGLAGLARLGHSQRTAYRRLPRRDFEAQVNNWPLDGPQTWDERKLWRIEKARPFGFATTTRAHA